jgi:troponin I
MPDEAQQNVQKTAEELKKQQERDAKEREQFLASRIKKLELSGLDKSGLEKKVRELYEAVSKLEEEKYDCEFKLRKIELETNELNIAVNDIKGHFVKPPLNKISKTEQKLAKIAEVKSKLGSAFRENLKSTGQPKFALDEKEDTGKKPDWGQDQLKQHAKEEEGAGEEAAAEEAEEEEE